MKYDLEYYEDMLRKNSTTAETISKIRWKFLEQIDPCIVLDCGSGVGWFRAWRPKGMQVYSYDIADYPQTGLKIAMYDCVCFWDVLEHIDDFRDIEPVLNMARHVAVSLPIKPDKPKYADWKHFRPGEHLHYWTEETLDALFERYGFEKIISGNPECPPRNDILSVIYKKIDPYEKLRKWKSSKPINIRAA